MVGSKPTIARAVIEAAPAEKEIVDVHGGHFGLLWHPSAEFDRAVDAQREFLLRVLA